MPWGVLGIKNVYDKEEVLNVHPVVVGGGTDSASVNIGQHSRIKDDAIGSSLDILVLVPRSPLGISMQ